MEHLGNTLTASHSEPPAPSLSQPLEPDPFLFSLAAANNLVLKRSPHRRPFCVNTHTLTLSISSPNLSVSFWDTLRLSFWLNEEQLQLPLQCDCFPSSSLHTLAKPQREPPQNIHALIRLCVLKWPVSASNPCKRRLLTATKLGYCVTPLHYINKDHVTQQRASRLDDRGGFPPCCETQGY